MAKDFAVLFNIEKWLKSTADMDSDVRGWYLNLLLHQYDKDGLPNDIERLAVLAGVRHSEYKRFEQVFKQVFEHKFICSEDGKLRNAVMSQIMIERQNFKESRERAGKISYILKVFRRLHGDNEEMERLIKARFDPSWNIKSEQVLEQVFTTLFEHLRSISINNGSNGINTNTIHRDKFLQSSESQEAAFKYAKSIGKTMTIDHIRELADVHNSSFNQKFPNANYSKWYQYFEYFIKDMKQQDKRRQGLTR